MAKKIAPDDERTVELTAGSYMMRDGKPIASGERFACTPLEAADLLAMRMAREPRAGDAEPGTYNRRDMRARNGGD